MPGSACISIYSQWMCPWQRNSALIPSAFSAVSGPTLLITMEVSVLFHLVGWLVGWLLYPFPRVDLSHHLGISQWLEWGPHKKNKASSLLGLSTAQSLCFMILMESEKKSQEGALGCPQIPWQPCRWACQGARGHTNERSPSLTSALKNTTSHQVQVED